MADWNADGFPKRIYVVVRKDGDDTYLDAAENVDDWKPEYVENMAVAVYELKTIGKTITTRRFVLPPGESE